MNGFHIISKNYFNKSYLSCLKTAHIIFILQIAFWGSNPATSVDKVKYANVTKDEDICKEVVSQEWAKNIYKTDKLCGPPLPPVGVCNRIAGSGWAVKNPQDDRFYLHGISSKGYSQPSQYCDITYPYFYTNLSHYYEFITGELYVKESPVYSLKIS